MCVVTTFLMMQTRRHHRNSTNCLGIWRRVKEKREISAPTLPTLRPPPFGPHPSAPTLRPPPLGPHPSVPTPRPPPFAPHPPPPHHPSAPTFSRFGPPPSGPHPLALSDVFTNNVDKTVRPVPVVLFVACPCFAFVLFFRVRFVFCLFFFKFSRSKH